jgi:membrane-associated phospholipid phosphatase
LISYYLFRKKIKRALDIAMIGLGSTGILNLLKEIFKRQRPLDPLIRDVTGFSYPSGHSFSSFTFFGLLIYILWKTSIKKTWKIILSIVLFLIAATIAFSRVYLRVHYPSDVVAGFCLSITWLMLSLWILHKADRGIAPLKK